MQKTVSTPFEGLELRLILSPALQIPSIGFGEFADTSTLAPAQKKSLASLGSVSRRREFAKNGKARPDGSFPIPDVTHLRKALRAYALANPAEKSAIRRFTVRRARALGATKYLPESWGVINKSVGKRPIIADAARSVADDKKGLMVAAYPPPDVAAVLAGPEEGDHSLEDLHVTVVYFGEDATPQTLDAVRRATFEVTSRREMPLTAYATGPGTFDTPEGDKPRFYHITAPGLKELRDAIIAAVEEVGGAEPNTDYDFTPHMTVRYGGLPLTELPEGGDAPWQIDGLAIKNGEDVEILPFGHDFIEADDEGQGICEICGQRADAPVHQNEKVPSHLEDMIPDNPISSDAIGDSGESFNWVEDTGGLPLPIKDMAKAIMRGGKKNESTAIAIAVSQAKKLVAKSKNPQIKAKYAAAVAQWEAMKAKARADNVAVASGKPDSYLKNPVPFDIVDIELIEPNRDRVSLLDLQEGRMTTTASAAAWTEGGEFYWDDETNVVYAVEDNVVSTFDGSAWVPAQNMSATDVQMFPTVDDADTMEAITAAGEGETPELPKYAGAEFEIDLVIPEGVPSGDTRSFSEGALEHLEPPFPLFWQKTSGEGHSGSVTVGKFTHIERTEAGLGRAKGVFDTSEDAIEAARQVDEEMLLGVSGDIDQFKAEMSTDEESGEEKVLIHHGRLVGATLVGKPAFQECRIRLKNNEGGEAVVASGGPLQPPSDWFRDPGLQGPTRLTVNEEGRVFGHIATWGTPHTGNPSLNPPKSNTGYKFFRTGSVRTADGFDVSVGQLTLAGGHAGLDLSADRAIAHYDDTKSAVADVACGEDSFGIWVAGSARPGISEEQLYAFRASSPSGDWRKLENNLELVAVCQVNTPGFPVPKTMIASGETYALVAAGTAQLVDPVKHESLEKFGVLEDRLAAVELFMNDIKANAVRSRAESAIDRLRG